VHIADVCEYVCDNSPIDIEAKKRCATINDGFTKSEMLPERIVSDICDLSKSGDKLTLSFLLDIDSNGNVSSIDLEESVIRIAQSCVYSELEQLLHAQDASSIMFLRMKYEPYTSSILDMYELAAIFSNTRQGRNVPDWINTYRVFERSSEGKIVSYKTVDEPDVRAMIKEIGYFVSNVVGEYMAKNKLPVIYIGQAPGPESIISYLEGILGIKPCHESLSARAVDVTEHAKGSPYYQLVCRLLGGGLPASEFSDKPIENILCGTETVVSFFRPATHYTDLLTLRALKDIIRANGDVKNLNLNRHKKVISEAAILANKAETYLYSANRAFMRESALEYLEYSGQCCIAGHPLKIDESGCIPVLLDCGTYAVITSDDAKGFDFTAGDEYKFEVIALGTEEEPTIVRPCI
jgi:ribonuclease R